MTERDEPYTPSLDEARTEYFKALDLLGAIKDRAKREGKLK